MTAGSLSVFIFFILGSNHYFVKSWHPPSFSPPSDICLTPALLGLSPPPKSISFPLPTFPSHSLSFQLLSFATIEEIQDNNPHVMHYDASPPSPHFLFCPHQKFKKWFSQGWRILFFPIFLGGGYYDNKCSPHYLNANGNDNKFING